MSIATFSYNVEAVEGLRGKEGLKRIRVLAPLVIGSKVYIQTPNEQRRFEVTNVIHAVLAAQGGNEYKGEWHEAGYPWLTLKEF